MIQDKPKLRVLQVVTQLEAGGAQGAALRMANELRARGHEAHTVFLYRKFRSHTDDAFHTVISERKPTNALALLRSLVTFGKFARQYRPTAIVGYGRFGNALIGLANIFRATPARIATIRSPFTKYPLALKLVDTFLSLSGIYTDVIAVSESAANTVRWYPRRKRDAIMVVPNGISFSEIDDHLQLPALEMNLPAGSKLLVSVGRLSLEKNHEVLIRALQYLPSDFHLAIAGQGPLKAELQALARTLNVEQQLHLLGQLSRQELVRLLKAADLFLFPSRYEAFGFAVIEAMAVGLKPVVSDIDTMREIVGRHGTYVSPDDASGWGDAIMNVMHQRKPQSRLEIVEHAKGYSLSNMADRYEGVIVTRLKGMRQEKLD